MERVKNNDFERYHEDAARIEKEKADFYWGEGRKVTAADWSPFNLVRILSTVTLRVRPRARNLPVVNPLDYGFRPLN